MCEQLGSFFIISRQARAYSNTKSYGVFENMRKTLLKLYNTARTGIKDRH